MIHREERLVRQTIRSLSRRSGEAAGVADSRSANGETNRGATSFRGHGRAPQPASSALRDPVRIKANVAETGLAWRARSF